MMIFRQAELEEIRLLFEHGYQEWSKNRSFAQYCIDNSKEDTIGKRYVLVKDGEIVSSAIILTLNKIDNMNVYGIGSVVTPHQHRGNGYASQLLDYCINLIYKDQTLVFLYSDINPVFYEKFNFRTLPASLQKYPKSICMVLCKDRLWNELIYYNLQAIPNYF